MGQPRFVERGVLIAAVVLVSGIAGCTATPPAGSSRPASPSPSASATTTADPLTAPDSQLPGTCSDFVSADSVNAVLGAVGVPDDISLPPDYLASRRQSGDMNCTWAAAGGHPELAFELRRHAGVLAADPLGWWSAVGTPAGVGADRSNITCSDTPGAGGLCRIQAIVGDYWFDLLLITPDGTPARARREQVVAAASAVVERLGAETVPPLWQPPTGAWPTRIDCTALAARADLSAALGIPGLTVEDTSALVEGFRMSDAVAHLGGRSQCNWSNSSTGQEVGAVFVSGGGWALTALSPGATRVDIPGTDFAQRSCESDRPTVCAVDARIGVNLLTVANGSANTAEAQLAVATAIVAGLQG